MIKVGHKPRTRNFHEKKNQKFFVVLAWARFHLPRKIHSQFTRCKILWKFYEHKENCYWHRARTRNQQKEEIMISWKAKVSRGIFSDREHRKEGGILSIRDEKCLCSSWKSVAEVKVSVLCIFNGSFTNIENHTAHAKEKTPQHIFLIILLNDFAWLIKSHASVHFTQILHILHLLSFFPLSSSTRWIFMVLFPFCSCWKSHKC